MSQTAATVILAAVVVMLIKTRWLRLSGAVLAVALGVCLAVGPFGPTLVQALDGVGSWLYASLQAL